ncbi:MAG: cell division protein FtsZ [Candidatus Diapherotrites archaeon]|nr:cell division protein FtsZ [Candidatus Diapherotrites archaeon]
MVAEAIDKKPVATTQTYTDYEAPRIVVVGAGGGGCNTIHRLSTMGIRGAEMYAVNTDRLHLEHKVSDEVNKILIGGAVTKGKGAGGYPEMGRKAAEVSKNELAQIVEGCDLVFLTAGMGGGTGTGSAPLIAELAKEQGAIVIAMVTYPFNLERARLDKAEQGIQRLSEVADTVIVIDNNRLREILPNVPMMEAFRVADTVIARTVQGITETITQPSLINLDFSDLRAIMSNAGLSVIAVGESRSVDKVNEVVDDTLNNALLDVNITGATGALIHITGGTELTLGEANLIGEMLTERIDPQANVVWGARLDPEFENHVRVICIFTGVTSPYVHGKMKGVLGDNKTPAGQDDLGLASWGM